MKTYLVQCNCGRWNARAISNAASYILKCSQCGRSTKLKQKNVFGLVLKIKGPFIAKFAVEECKRLNAEVGNVEMGQAKAETYY